jgi:hypothetical protein
MKQHKKGFHHHQDEEDDACRLLLCHRLFADKREKNIPTDGLIESIHQIYASVFDSE